MKKWEFQCPKEAFIEFAIEIGNELYIPKDPSKTTHKDVTDFVEKFLKKHFMDYYDNGSK